MSLVLVDTDWVIDALNGQRSALMTLQEPAPDGIALTVVTYGEPYQGANDAREPVGAPAALQGFVGGKDLLPVTAAIAARLGIRRGQLPRHLRQQIGDMDLPIAATALTHDRTLPIRSSRDSRRTPRLNTDSE